LRIPVSMVDGLHTVGRRYWHLKPAQIAFRGVSMIFKGLLASVSVVVVLAAAACGGGDVEASVVAEPTADSGVATPTSAPAATPTVASAPSPTPAPDSAQSPESESGDGTLRMLVSDEENAIADFAQLIVRIEMVSLSSDDGIIDLPVAAEDQEVDLVQLQGDAAE